jgi:hypothetical protein
VTTRTSYISYTCLKFNILIVFFRAKETVLPQQPVNRRDLMLNVPWNQTLDGRHFVLIDDGADDKIVVLCTPQNFDR